MHGNGKLKFTLVMKWWSSGHPKKSVFLQIIPEINLRNELSTNNRIRFFFLQLLTTTCWPIFSYFSCSTIRHVPAHHYCTLVEIYLLMRSVSVGFHFLDAKIPDSNTMMSIDWSRLDLTRFHPKMDRVTR